MCNKNICILSQPVHSGKTSLLMEWVKKLPSVNGILAPDVDGNRKLFDISSKEYHDFQTDNNITSEIISIGKYRFLKSSLDLGRNILRRSLHESSQWLLVDEIGKLEVQQHSGFEPAVSEIIHHYQKNKVQGYLLLVIRDYLLEEGIKKYNLGGSRLIDKSFFERNDFQFSSVTKPLYGLILCGGKSSRMGTDKYFIDYHGKPQCYHLYDILQLVCMKVFISCNQEQRVKINEKYDCIIDSEKYSDIGPMAGLLSAFEKHPETSWLVVGCDYPMIDSNDLMRLMEARTENTPAISYFNFKELKEDPVLAVYERECYPLLFKNFNEGKYSLREFLRENNCEKIIPSSLEKLRSIDSSAEFEEISSYLQRRL